MGVVGRLYSRVLIKRVRDGTKCAKVFAVRQVCE